MKKDADLQVWREVWNTGDAVRHAAIESIRDLLTRERRRMVVSMAAELLVGSLLLAFAISIAMTRRSAEAFVWAGIIWVLTLVASIFSISNWRGTWRVEGHSCATFLALYRARCQASLRTVRFGIGLLILEMLVAVPWLLWRAYSRGEPNAQAVPLAITLGLAAVFVVWFRRVYRIKSQELRRLEEIAAELTDRGTA